jgi:hypothetical protein
MLAREHTYGMHGVDCRKALHFNQARATAPSSFNRMYSAHYYRPGMSKSRSSSMFYAARISSRIIHDVRPEMSQI